MAYRNKYQRQKQQYSIDGGYSWVDVSPANYRRGRLIEAASDDCNTEEWIEITGSWFCVGDETIERWVDDGTECVDYDKYNIQRRQISNDGGNTWTNTEDTRRGTLIEANSTDCGYVEYQYRWVAVSDDFICYGADKYEKQKEQRSSDGINWTDTGNVRRGTLFEKNSVDCGVTYTDFDCGINFTYLNEYDRLFIDNDAATFNLISTLVNDMTGNIKVNFSFQIRKDMSDFDWVLRNANNVMVASNYIGRVVAGDLINDSFEVPCGDYNLLFVVNQESSYGTVTKYAMSRLTHICNDCENPPLERWVVVDNDYVCDGTTKYNKEKEQVSYDGGSTWTDTGNTRRGNVVIERYSIDCGYVPLNRWVLVDNDYCCVGNDKYTVEKEQVSNDGGSTWTDTGNTRTGSVIERDSQDCLYTSDYLTITSLADNNNIYWTNSASSTSGHARTVQISTDGGTTWTSKMSQRYQVSIATLNTGDKLLIKGTNTGYYNSYANHFTSDYNVDLSGNIMSLVYGDDFAGQTELTAENTFRGIFTELRVVNAENLVLPATTLAKSCYRQMFYNCTSLATAPVLPATTLANYCYQYMFYNCTSLTVAPELTATTLKSNCYSGMFYNCTSLATAPVLPATILTDYCYASMFNGCTSLNYIKCLAIVNMTLYSTYNWVSGVASSGTFVKNGSATWDTGTSGIPTGWTVETASE